MSTDFDKYQFIQDYLRGELNAEQIDVFNKLLVEEATFAQLFEEEKAIDAIMLTVVKKEISTDVQEGFKAEKSRRKKQTIRNTAIGALVVATVIGLLQVTKYKEEATITFSSKQESNVQTQVKDLPVQTESITSDDNEQPTLTVQTNQVPTYDTTFTPLTEPIITTIVVEEEQQTSQPTAEPTISKTYPATQVHSPKVNTTPTSCTGRKTKLNIIKNVPCLFGELGSLEIEALKGKAPFSYTINNLKLEEGYVNGLQAGIYTITVQDTDECLVAKKDVTLKQKRCYDLPLSFNPAYSNWNYESGEIVVELKILNRFGNEVFKTESENPQWNGKTNNGDDLPLDDYIFFISRDGQVIDKGNVTLVRQ